MHCNFLKWSVVGKWIYSRGCKAHATIQVYCESVNVFHKYNLRDTFVSQTKITKHSQISKASHVTTSLRMSLDSFNSINAHRDRDHILGKSQHKYHIYNKKLKACFFSRCPKSIGHYRFR